MKQIKLAGFAIPSFLLICLWSVSLSHAQTQTRKITLAEGTVLRLALSARTPIGRIGQPVEATVIEPVYSFDTLVIPENAKVYGTVEDLVPIPMRDRVMAIAGGDLTPMRDPVIEFERLLMPGGEMIPIETEATNRNTNVVEIHDRQSKGTSLSSTAKSMAQEKLGFGAGLTRWNLIRREQELERGSLLDATLTEPLEIAVPASDPVDTSHIGESMPPDTLLHARLLTEMSSNGSVKGTPIEAVVTEPVWGSGHELLFPEGTRLVGSVVKAKAAGWFGKSGELRFNFGSLWLPAGTEEKIQAQVEALDAQKNAHITLDAEGGTRARMNHRFISPVINATLAEIASRHSGNRIKRAVVSNGFGLVGRIVGYAGIQEVSIFLSYYGLAQSIYTNFLQKGLETGFPVNTRLEIRVNLRQAQP